jgi:hypothetical protein
MTKINSISTIPVAKQRTIKKWYTSTIQISIILMIILLIITCIDLYYTTTYTTLCVPRINKEYTQNIKKKYTTLHAGIHNKKKYNTIKADTQKNIKSYAQILAAHIEKPVLNTVVTIQLSSKNVLLTYTANSLESVQTYIKELRTISSFGAITLESFEQPALQNRNTTCTIHAEFIE